MKHTLALEIDGERHVLVKVDGLCPCQKCSLELMCSGMCYLRELCTSNEFGGDAYLFTTKEK